MGRVIDIGTDFVLTAHASVGIFVVGHHVVLPVKVFGKHHPDATLAGLALAAHWDGKMESRIVLATRQDAIDTNSILAEMTGDIKAGTIVTINKAASRKSGFQLRGTMIIAGLSQNGDPVGLVEMIAVIVGPTARPVGLW